MRNIVIAVISAFILTGGLIADITAQYHATAMRHSCGYHCNPDGSGATPAAPPQRDPTVHSVRVNVHSGGRTGGFANPRVGCGGCSGHPQ